MNKHEVTMFDDMKRLIRDIQAALGTEETGLNLVKVARDAHEAEMRMAALDRDFMPPFEGE